MCLFMNENNYGLREIGLVSYSVKTLFTMLWIVYALSSIGEFICSRLFVLHTGVCCSWWPLEPI